MRLCPFLAALCLAATPATADIATITPDQFDWQETPEGVAFAALDGDRFAESYMAMVRLPAGLVSPAHVKTEDMFGLMMSGEMAHVPAGIDPASATPIGPGGWYHIPGGEAHVSACVSEVECVTFLHQPGAFDFSPVTP